jgi:hypothetical protein
MFAFWAPAAASSHRGKNGRVQHTQPMRRDAAGRERRAGTGLPNEEKEGIERHLVALQDRIMV